MAAKQIILITGGNTGLGLEIVRKLYTSPKSYEIIIGCRTESKGAAAISQVQSEIPSSNSTLSTVQVDITSDTSITSARGTIASRHGHLDCLINNAGANFDVQYHSGKMSLREAWNESWNTNVSGTMVITSELIPLLLKSSDPRLIFITSGTSSLEETERHDLPAFQRLNASPPQGWPKDSGPNPVTMYRSVKCGMNMAFREWVRILGNDGVKVWAVSPGFLATGLAGIGEEKLKQMGAIDPAIGGEFVKDVVEGKRDEDVGKIIRKDSIQPF
ncbi:Short-chain dehydrogenase/reductase eupG [Pseudocercospora fuligena]|uniref:Short-chain dehydrogenase/reductase eupG n=1 Tax=Pseudocercospora fuligena TaxID=685502 RepID=A0A8H6RLZ1_9PEZI|nr:Short-chain dehydrogenase/reductase eupG [Pseudocercospora fuligena]